jgi:hypothetical protein
LLANAPTIYGGNCVTLERRGSVGRRPARWTYAAAERVGILIVESAENLELPLELGLDFGGSPVGMPGTDARDHAVPHHVEEPGSGEQFRGRASSR